MKKAPLMTLLAASLVLVACQQAGGGAGSSTGAAPAARAADASMPRGFTCCNLYYNGDWISDANYGEALPFLPAGTPAEVTGYGRYRVLANVGGKAMRIGLDYGREQLTLPQYAAQVIVPTDPKLKIATWPADIRRAVALGKVMPGMTREQVITSVGYPLATENRSLDAPMWRLWVTSFDEYQVNFGPDGRVREVNGLPTVLSRVVHKPGT